MLQSTITLKRPGSLRRHTISFFVDIEVGKASFWLLCAGAFVASYTALHTGLRFHTLTAALVALAIVANPIAISQSLSYYIDGHVYCLLVVSFVCFYTGGGGKAASWDVYALFFYDYVATCQHESARGCSLRLLHSDVHLLLRCHFL